MNKIFNKHFIFPTYAKGMLFYILFLLLSSARHTNDRNFCASSKDETSVFVCRFILNDAKQ